MKSATAVSGPEASAGFTALLRRSIRPEQLLDVCLDEWAKSFARRPRYRGEQMKLARQLLKQTDPVAAYGAIQRLLVQTHGRSENSLEKPCFAEAGLIAATTPAVSERN
ncbi:MAG: hypothetical protein N3B01_00850 [Verrucomicrobiae bacterium]|nr:hypothetical protein [Verrucomicrobiae bacterium]